MFYNKKSVKGKFMVSGASLLSTIPMPAQNWQTKTTAPVASIKVGDVTDEGETQSDNRSFLTKFIDNMKEKFIQKRIKKLESIAPEHRTPAQQAEIDANKQSLNYVI